jgi:hypothetical protein
VWPGTVRVANCRPQFVHRVSMVSSVLPAPFSCFFIGCTTAGVWVGFLPGRNRVRQSLPTGACSLLARHVDGKYCDGGIICVPAPHVRVRESPRKESSRRGFTSICCTMVIRVFCFIVLSFCCMAQYEFPVCATEEECVKQLEQQRSMFKRGSRPLPRTGPHDPILASGDWSGIANRSQIGDERLEAVPVLCTVNMNATDSRKGVRACVRVERWLCAHTCMHGVLADAPCTNPEPSSYANNAQHAAVVP